MNTIKQNEGILKLVEELRTGTDDLHLSYADLDDALHSMVIACETNGQEMKDQYHRVREIRNFCGKLERILNTK